MDFEEKPKQQAFESDSLKPPTFSVRTFCFLIFLLSLIFAVGHYFGVIAAFGLLLFYLAVFAHLAGAYVGDRLKRKPRRLSEPSQNLHAKQVNPTLTKESFAPASTLSKNTPIAFWMRCINGIAVLIGIGIGAYGSSWVDPREFNYAVLAVCCISGGALSGILAFCLCGFFEQTLRSWLQATSDK